MSEIQLALIATGFLPIALGAIVAWRVKQSDARDLAEIDAFARAENLQGNVAGELSLRGTFDGLPCYATLERVPGPRGGTAAYARFRLLTREASASPDAPSAAPGALLVARGEALPFGRVSGAHEVATGDAAFDAAYRVFVAPRAASPWNDAALRSSLLAMTRYVAYAEQGPAETSVTLSAQTPRANVYARALRVAAALVGPEAAHRHHAELAAPLDAPPPKESRRLSWATARLLIVTIGGMVVGIPVTLFAPPMRDVIEDVACRRGERLAEVGSGRGTTMVCYGKHGRRNDDASASLWATVIGVDTGWVGALAVFSIAELAAALARRRSPR